MKYSKESLDKLLARVRQERISAQHGSPSDVEIAQAQLADMAGDYIPGLVEVVCELSADLVHYNKVIDGAGRFGQQLTHAEVANKVRMLTRSDLDHELVCVLGRDRIIVLAKENAEMAAQLATLEAEAAAANQKLEEERARHKVEVLDILRDLRLPRLPLPPEEDSEGEMNWEHNLVCGQNKERQAINDYCRQKAYEYDPQGIGPDSTEVGQWDTRPAPKPASALPLEGGAVPTDAEVMCAVFKTVLLSADLWDWFLNSYGTDWQAEDSNSDGWAFEKNAVTYRVCDLFSADHSEGNNWRFERSDSLDEEILTALVAVGFKITHNSGDEEDAYLRLELPEKAQPYAPAAPLERKAAAEPKKGGQDE